MTEFRIINADAAPGPPSTALILAVEEHACPDCKPLIVFEWEIDEWHCDIGHRHDCATYTRLLADTTGVAGDQFAVEWSDRLRGLGFDVEFGPGLVSDYPPDDLDGPASMT